MRQLPLGLRPDLLGPVDCLAKLVVDILEVEALDPLFGSLQRVVDSTLVDCRSLNFACAGRVHSLLQ